ncbi:MAG: Hydroxypyruvate reductase [Gammaproteobacteria bacterium]|nr:Hydroxypyruvate reductase [Gammaproteobacteria bacterium]
MYSVLTFNNISPAGLERFDETLYKIDADNAEPDAVLLRSYDMHEWPIPDSLKAVGRAGAGVNNIPVTRLGELGIPVFNAPGANANAVKELVLAGLLLAGRNICGAWDYTRNLEVRGEELKRAVESGKKQYAGFELPGRTIGIVGLGSIGRLVANVCIHLGMKVIGYDPMLTVDGAWLLTNQVQRAANIEQLLSRSDFVTFHVPLNDSTRHMINTSNIHHLKRDATILNFARDGVVEEGVVCEATAEGRLHAYVTDFPNDQSAVCKRVIELPHLGASTREAENNSAVMVVEQIRDFFENGNILNSVNFPEVNMLRGSPYRLVMAHANVPNMLGQISTAMANAALNIHDMINQSRGPLAYTVVDTDSPIPEEVVDRVRTVEGVTMARSL